MSRIEDREPLISTENLEEHLKTTLRQTLAQNKVEAEQETILYIVQILLNYLRSDQLFERSEHGLQIRPLALHYIEALQHASLENRDRSLQQLGDIALFIAGLFADSLERKPVDIDYYIAMGGNAYGHLAQSVHTSRRGIVFRQIFAELAEKFTQFVDALGEINDHANMQYSANILRLYELWRKTGSTRAARRLRALGIEPLTTPVTTLQH
ncbi:MAG: hypothetical protein Kow006_27730 [Gammaproteobacteria bacterium]